MWLMLVACNFERYNEVEGRRPNLEMDTDTDADSDSDTDADSDSDTDADSDSDTDADADSDTDADADSDTDADADTDTDADLDCGDGTCSGETCDSCPIDCGACTPSCNDDGSCAPADGETCESCNDCDTTDPVCGNGACDTNESPSSCGVDCGPPVWPADWAQIELDIIVEMNAHRAAGTDCPSGPKAVADPLSLDATLQTASRLHSWDQSYEDYFSHSSCNGRNFSARASAVGATSYGETITWNASSAASIVGLWMGSTSGHCDAVMNPSSSFVGPGYADVIVPIGTANFR